MVSNVNLVLNSSVTQKYNLIFRFKRKNKKHLKCTLLPEIVAYILRGSCINNKHSIQQNTPEKKQQKYITYNSSNPQQKNANRFSHLII